jgi:hypothetical protein
MMEAKKEPSELVKRALAILSGKVESAEIPPESADQLAVSVLTDNEPDEIGQILEVWQRTFGMTLNRDRVVNHLRSLREWQGQLNRAPNKVLKPKP